MSKLSVPKKVTLNSGESYQRITYPCGCEAVGKAPMPINCPTHNVKSASPETLVSVILDESGSMQSCWDSTISAYNEYLKGLTGGNYLISLTKFDTQIPYCRVQYTNIPVASAPHLNKVTYVPSGGTPLYDAIGGTISALSPTSNGRPVIVVIVTDGEENSSREYDAGRVKSMIEEYKAKGWTFVFLAANVDAWAVGQKFGMTQGSVANYTTANVKGMMTNMVTATRGYSANYASAPIGSSGSLTMAENFFTTAGVDANALDNVVSSGTGVGSGTPLTTGIQFIVNPMSDSITSGSAGGIVSAANLTPDERKKRASNAAKTRWHRSAQKKDVKA